MTQVNMLEAKTNLSKLVEAVESGAEDEIIIARNGKPVARIVPMAPKRNQVRLGLAEGKYPTFTWQEWQESDAEVAKMFEEQMAESDERLMQYLKDRAKNDDTSSS